VSGREPTDHEAGDRPRAAVADVRFHRRVRDLVAIVVGPIDALEPARAERVAADVLVQTIVHVHNRRMLGDEREQRLADLRTIGEALRGTMETIVGRVLSGGGEDVRSAARRIACAAFALARRAEFVDTDEIPWLVALAYGVGLELYRRDPEAARRLVGAADAVSGDG